MIRFDGRDRSESQKRGESQDVGEPQNVGESWLARCPIKTKRDFRLCHPPEEDNKCHFQKEPCENKEYYLED